jgi:hypothetical protein
MKRLGVILIIIAFVVALPAEASAQKSGRQRKSGDIVEIRRDENGEEYLYTPIKEVTIRGKLRYVKNYERMVRAVKKVYPLAKEASKRMAEITVDLEELRRRDRKQYTSAMEEALKKELTPMLWKMTRYEGVILLKLLDRETDKTAFSIIKLYRSGFVAGFYQTLARLFGNNLKLEYDPEGEDRTLEQIVRYYEQGLL